MQDTATASIYFPTTPQIAGPSREQNSEDEGNPTGGIHWTISGLHRALFRDGKARMVDDIEDYMYAGLDLKMMFEEIYTRYQSRRDLTADLVLINSVTFMRGYSYEVTKKP